MACRERRAEARTRYRAATDLPLLVLAAAMIPLLAVPLFVDLGGAAEQTVVLLDWSIWSVFAFDYLVGLCLADSRRRYVFREWPNLLIVVVPFLRPLRLVRSARMLRLLRLTRLFAFVAETTREGRRLLTRHHLHYALLVTGAVVLGSTVLVTAAEQGTDGGIENLADGLWWATATVTTVGYGDAVPVTPAGRAVAVFLMLTGIALYGLVASNLAAFLLERDEQDERSEVARLSEQLDEVLRRLDTLDARLAGTDTLRDPSEGIDESSPDT